MIRFLSKYNFAILIMCCLAEELILIIFAYYIKIVFYGSKNLIKEKETDRLVIVYSEAIWSTLELKNILEQTRKEKLVSTFCAVQFVSIIPTLSVVIKFVLARTSSCLY